MAITVGDADTSSKMAQAIYLAMGNALRPSLEATMTDEQIDTNVAPAWKNLSGAIASGVVSSAQSSTFWTWLSGFVGVFQTWADGGDGSASGLQTALKNFFADNPIPTELKGAVE